MNLCRCFQRSIIILFIVFATNNCFSQTLDGDGLIPLLNQLDWHNAGNLTSTPSQATHIYDITDPSYTGSDWEKITTALDDAKNNTPANGFSIIYIPAGNYSITQPIAIDNSYSNIVIQGDGAGPDGTFLNFQVGVNNNCFKIFGVESADPGHYAELNNSVIKDSYTITFSSASDIDDFGTDDWIRFCEDNCSYLSEPWAIDSKVVGQINQIDFISGATMNLKNKASKGYYQGTNNKLWVKKFSRQ